MEYRVTAKVLSQCLDLSESMVCKFASDGQLPGVKIGESWQFDLRKVLTIIKEVEKEIIEEENKKRKKNKKEMSDQKKRG
jgi:hypothetical protein